jgi:hypothetical protein
MPHSETERRVEKQEIRKGLGCIFGSDVPVGYNIDERANRVGAQQSADDGEFSPLLHSL